MKTNPAFRLLTLNLGARPAARSLLAFLALLFLPVATRADFRRIILSVDMTPEGRKIAPPSPGHPTYYYPFYNGYEEVGGAPKFYVRKPADDDAIQRSLTDALAKQGYLPATSVSPASIVLAFRWGTIAPQKRGRTVLNEAEMEIYTLGDSWRDVNQYTSTGKELLRTDIARHFVLISALDYHAFFQRKAVLLWRAHVSDRAWGAYLDEVLPTLIASVAPSLGRETKPGVTSIAVEPPAGHVLLGQPIVVPTPSPAKTK